MLFLLENTDTHKHSHKALHSYEPGRDILKGVDQLKANFSSQQTRSQELAKIRAALVDGDAVGAEPSNDVDVMSGMLNNLDVNIFQGQTSQDVDIEAISLMGIGSGALGGGNPNNALGGGGTTRGF